MEYKRISALNPLEPFGYISFLEIIWIEKRNLMVIVEEGNL
jgi:hypothetical protein